MNSHTPQSIRSTLFIGFILCVSMIGIALFMQYVMELIPCPLCSVQRAIVIALGTTFLLATLQNPKYWGRRFYGFLLTILSIAGLIVSGRHTWLQHLPEDKIPECGPGLEFWINNLPANQVIQKVFQGSGECAEVVFNFMGLSIPEWSLIAFGLFFSYSIKLLFLAR